MYKYTEGEIPTPAGEVPVEQSYEETLGALDDAKLNLDRSSRSLLNCFSSAESSNPQFIRLRAALAELAAVYMDTQFPESVKVVRDLRNVFFLYSDYDVKKFKKNIRAMEKSVTEQATNSEFLLRLHRLLLSDLEGVQLSTGKILDSIEEEAAQKREDYLVLLENAQTEKERFYAQKERYDADKEMYYKEKEVYDAERAKYLAERDRYKAAEEKHDDKAHKMRKKKDDAEILGAAGLVGAGVGVAVGTGAFIAAAPVVLAAGSVAGIVGAAMAMGGILGRRNAEGSEKEATTMKESAKENAEEATKMGEKAIAYGEKAIANGVKASANAVRAAANAEKALRDGKRAADRATHEARECDKAVQLIKNDLINSLTLFMKAMEKVSEFLSKLASDIDDCLEKVTKPARAGMGRMEDHLTCFRKYEAPIVKSCDSFRSFQVIVQARVDVLRPILKGTDAAAGIKSWCSKHEASGRLQQHESRDILVRLYPAQFPSVTKHAQSSRLRRTILKHLSWH